MRATHARRGKTGNYTCSPTPLHIIRPLPTLTTRMNSARARKWSRKKLSDTARGRPTEPREHLRIAHLSVNATKLHQKSKFRLILVMMGFSLSNPERSVQRNKRPHELLILVVREWVFSLCNPESSVERRKRGLRETWSQKSAARGHTMTCNSRSSTESRNFAMHIE